MDCAVDDGRVTRHDLTDDQWAVLEPLMPTHPRQGHRWSDHRVIVNGVLHRTRTGTSWRDLPERFGPWQTVYNRHRRWSGDGTWERILAALQAGSDRAGDDGGDGDWAVAVDSTVVRAHQHAAGARHAPPKDIDPARLQPTALSAPSRPGPHPGSPAEASGSSGSREVVVGGGDASSKPRRMTRKVPAESLTGKRWDVPGVG